MQKITAIRLPEDLVNYLQALDYESGGLQVLHTHAINAGTPEETVKRVRERFLEVYQEYQLAKQELWADYSKEYPQCKRWWVDFQEGVLNLAE